MGANLLAFEMPPAEVFEPLLQLVGWFMWMVTLALVCAGVRSGIDVALAFHRGDGFDVAMQRPLIVALCSVFAASASGWAAFLLA